MGNLKEQFIRALQDGVGVASNSYLQFLRKAVDEVSDAVGLDDVLSDYNKTLLEVASQQGFVFDAKATNKFAQVLGEAHFYLLCKKNGVVLSRIEENTDKTPDFKIEDEDIYFEVKTISVVSGDSGIKTSLEDSLDSQIEIERQMNSGKRVASATTIIQPYGEKPYARKKGQITAVIETLIEKCGQNIKKGQFPNNKSFLVLNLSIIPPFRTENFVLRPAYCDDHMFCKAVSGELWMVAFSRLGIPILGMPDFEGEPCVESLSKKEGVLVDEAFDMVAGIIFMIHPWQRPAEIWGLFDYDKYQLWCDVTPSMVKLLMAITGNNWNDSRDSNGWQLQG
jgi:hypothetical protein